jgi:hypothetical protein
MSPMAIGRRVKDYGMYDIGKKVWIAVFEITEPHHDEKTRRWIQQESERHYCLTSTCFRYKGNLVKDG